MTDFESGRKWLDNWVIDPVTGFSIGYANVVSFGYSNDWQRSLYGNALADQNQSGWAYGFGTATGIGSSILMGYGGFASGGSLAAGGAWRTGLQAWTIGGDILGVAQSSYDVHNAQESLSDGLGFLPTIGWAGAAFRNARGFAGGATIATPLRGNAAAIYQGYGTLSGSQRGILDAPPDLGSATIMPKRSASMADLAALTAHTNDEFLMLTTGGRRMIMRGSTNGCHSIVNSQWAGQMASQGWRLSGHTHPIPQGMSDMMSLMSSEGDRAILDILSAHTGQQQSAIFNSKGRFSVFSPSGD